jgi:hypothetical protein
MMPVLSLFLKSYKVLWLKGKVDYRSGSVSIYEKTLNHAGGWFENNS